MPARSTGLTSSLAFQQLAFIGLSCCLAYTPQLHCIVCVRCSAFVLLGMLGAVRAKPQGFYHATDSDTDSCWWKTSLAAWWLHCTPWGDYSHLQAVLIMEIPDSSQPCGQHVTHSHQDLLSPSKRRHSLSALHLPSEPAFEAADPVQSITDHQHVHYTHMSGLRDECDGAAAARDVALSSHGAAGEAAWNAASGSAYRISKEVLQDRLAHRG